MNADKYYSHSNARQINLDTDGCSLEEWPTKYGKASFARHAEGFLIFLPPDKIDISDEYKESDPYSVEEDISSDFQTRRFESTITLLSKAISELDHTTGIKLLDLGCGEGHITNLIKTQFPDIEASGLDYSVSAIKYANANFSGIDFITGDAYEAPYSPEYFDIILLNNLWEHVPDPLFLLSKITYMLKPNGFIIISTPSRYRTENLARAILGKPVRLMSKYHVTEYSVGQIKEQLRFGGYELVETHSKPIKSYNVKSAIARMVFRVLLSINSSHHQLESTIFYLAKKAESRQ